MLPDRVRAAWLGGNRVLQLVISGTSILTTAYAGAIEVAISSTARITKTYYSAGSQLIANLARGSLPRGYKLASLPICLIRSLESTMLISCPGAMIDPLQTRAF